MNAYASKMRDALIKFKQGAVMRLDGWVNTATGFGTSRDKSEYGFVLPSRILTDTELSTLYHADDMAQRMVDVVPQEMFREGFAFETGDPLTDSALNDKFDTLEAPAKFAEASRWGRCFGGAGILIGADDGRDSELPLIPEKADDISFLYVIDRRLLWPMTYYDDPGHPKLGQPKTYLVTTIGGTHFNTALCHESRLILFRGANTGIRERHQLMGWDMSVLQRVYDVLRSFNTGWKSVETLLVDGNQAIFKMTGLAESLSSGGEEILRARMQAMDLYRSVMRAMVIDADGKESFERQAANFSGIPDTLEKFMLRLAAAVQIPVTILMGQSPAGMNATGDSDFRWFYDRIKAEQTMIAAPKIKRLGKIWLRTRAGQEHASKASKMMNVKFPALWTETPSAQAQRENTIATRDKTYIDSQVLSPEEVALHRFGSPDGFDREILITEEAIAARKSVLSGDIAKMAAPAAEEVTDPLAVDPGASTSAPSEGGGSMLKLTASDLASIVKVNEARASVGLGPLPGKEGEMTLPQFKATFASTIAAVANAERGTDPNAPPPEAAGASPGAPKLDTGDHFDARSTILLVDRDGKIEKSEHPSKAAARKAATEYLKSNGGKGKLVMAPKGMEHLVTPVPAQLHESGGDGENGDDRPRDEMGRFTSDAHAPIDSITIRETADATEIYVTENPNAPKLDAHGVPVDSITIREMMDAIEIHVTENGTTSSLNLPTDDQMKITIETNGKPKVTTEPTRQRFDASLRTFTLQRDEDESGFSGTGPVARGCVFEDGKVAMRWRTATASTTMFESIADVIKIHGHGGKTRVVFDDERADGWEDQERDELGRFGSGGGSAVEKAISNAEGGGRTNATASTALTGGSGRLSSKAGEKLYAAKSMVAATLARGTSRDGKPLALRNIPVEEHVAIAKDVAEAHAKEFAETKAQIASFAPKDAEVSGRTKKLDSVIEKLDRKADKYKDAHSLQDTTGIRVITKDLDGMKQTVANLEASGMKVIEKDDYVAKPKGDSGYRSVHLIVQTPSGLQKEVQIRTQDQHAHAEFAHDVYKPQTEAQAAFLRQNGDAVQKYSVDLGNHYQAIGEGKASTPPTPPPGLHQAFPKAPKT